MSLHGRANIVLLSLDAVRADRTCCWPGAPAGELTPSLRRLMGESVAFERCLAHSAWTVPNHATMFTGAYPCDHGILQPGSEASGPTVPLAARLAAEGYRTGCFSMVPLFLPGEGLTAGFEHVAPNEMRKDAKGVRRVTWSAVRWAREQGDRPFFLFLHHWGAHMPYLRYGVRRDSIAVPRRSAARQLCTPPSLPWRCARAVWRRLESVPGIGRLAHRYRAGRRARADDGAKLWGPMTPKRRLVQAVNTGSVDLNDREVAFLRARYDQRVRWADRLLGETLRVLRTQLDADRALLVVTSDHGDSLYEHHELGHISSLRNPVVHPFLVIRLPGGEHGGRRPRGLASHADIAPTVLDVLGLDPRGRLRGTSLLPAAAGEDLPDRCQIAELVLPHAEQDAVFDGGYKLLCDRTRRTEHLYRYPDDFAEHQDLAAAQPRQVERLKEKLRAARDEETGDRLGRGRIPPADPEVLRRLQDLGYL